MSICTSLGNSVPAKRVLTRERRTLVIQMERVKCMHAALSSLRMHGEV